MSSFHGYRFLIGFTLVLSAASVYLSALLFTRVADTTDRTNAVLCTFRNDVRQRSANGEQFLKEHPEGIPGIPVATIHQAIQGQRRTVKALRGLDCP